MNITRRGFLQAILAAGVAPAVVKAASLMPVRRLDSGLVLPDTFADEGIVHLSSSVWNVPEGVTSVYVSCFGGGGGSSGGTVSPFELADGSMFDLPVQVTPGQCLDVTLGKPRPAPVMVKWISHDAKGAVLTIQEFSQ